MRPIPEPSFSHGAATKTGILLVNLGSPEAPTAAAARPYLREFLSDRRVVEIPRLLWWLILNIFILPTRPAQSAKKYQKIWMKEGSPLTVHTQRQATLLRGYLGEKMRSPLLVDWAMRYGKPAIADAITRLKQQGCDRLLVLPLYPQYAAATTASTYDAVLATLARMRNVPELRMVKHYHDHPAYILALAASVNSYWMANGRGELLVMSFHGVPRFSLSQGDPYHCECHKTGRLLAQALGLKPEQYRITFQSRFGRAEWLKPYTMNSMIELGRSKTQRVDVVCPGFVADCLETLEEIAMENKDAFQQAGGGEFHYLPALNERQEWIEALCQIATENLGGWVHSQWDDRAAAQEGAASLARAKAHGATR